MKCGSWYPPHKDLSICRKVAPLPRTSLWVLIRFVKCVVMNIHCTWIDLKPINHWINQSVILKYQSTLNVYIYYMLSLAIHEPDVFPYYLHKEHVWSTPAAHLMLGLFWATCTIPMNVCVFNIQRKKNWSIFSWGKKKVPCPSLEWPHTLRLMHLPITGSTFQLNQLNNSGVWCSTPNFPSSGSCCTAHSWLWVDSGLPGQSKEREWEVNMMVSHTSLTILQDLMYSL
jgi:hypothetical protein